MSLKYEPSFQEILHNLTAQGPEREFFIDNLLVRIHFIIVMIRWTGLAPWEFEFPFPGILISTFLTGNPPQPDGTRRGSLRFEPLPAQGNRVGAARNRDYLGLHRSTPTLQGYLAHKNQPPPPRATIGP